MKICPKCQTRYTDDTLQFCLQDGTTLLGDESDSSQPTVAFNNEQETVVKKRPTDRIEFELQDSKQSQNWQQQQTTSSSVNYPTEPKKSNTGLIVVTTILAMLLIFGTGIAAYFVFFKDKNEVAEDANLRKSFPDNKPQKENTNIFAPPNATEKPNVKPTPTATPAPNFDPEKVKNDVTLTTESWALSAQSRDLSGYMKNYADSVDYYNKKGASIGTVRADKEKAFTKFDTIEINLSNIKVTPDASGEKATAVFDKEWFFENADTTSEGKVQTQLQMKKIGGAWKITSEKDLKVYYTR